MEITLRIPDEVARQLESGGGDPARLALEAFALEGYRTEVFSETAVKRILGFDTRLQVHAFLKQHGVYLHYSVEDAERDIEAAREFVPRIRAERQMRNNVKK